MFDKRRHLEIQNNFIYSPGMHTLTFLEYPPEDTISIHVLGEFMAISGAVALLAGIVAALTGLGLFASDTKEELIAPTHDASFFRLD